MERTNPLGRAQTLRELSPVLRTLFTAFLLTIGFGYLAAVFYLFLVDIDPHLKMGMRTIAGIEMKYRGQPSGSRLEAALRGAMADKLRPEERDTIVGWVRGGAKQAGFGQIKPILDRNCVACHSAKSGLPVPPLDSFEAVAKLAETDRGPSLAQLARVSHVHLFGLSFIFLLTGTIFAFSTAAPAFKLTVVALPFVAIWADIASWWLTRYEPLFAYVVFGGGALMGAALAVQILIPLWQMWAPRSNATAPTVQPSKP